MKTLVIFYPGCIEFEVMLACQILHEQYPLEIATPDGLEYVGSNGILIKPNISFAAVKIEEYKVLLIPGGNPAFLIGNQQLNTIVQSGHDRGAVIGAIGAGPLVLDQAGLLNGRLVAHGYKQKQLDFLEQNGFFKTSMLTNEAIVSEDRIVTARPDAFIDFAIEIARLTEVISEDKVDYWKSYYRGQSLEDLS